MFKSLQKIQMKKEEWQNPPSSLVVSTKNAAKTADGSRLESWGHQRGDGSISKVRENQSPLHYISMTCIKKLKNTPTHTTHPENRLVPLRELFSLGPIHESRHRNSQSPQRCLVPWAPSSKECRQKHMRRKWSTLTRAVWPRSNWVNSRPVKIARFVHVPHLHMFW